MKKNSSDIPLVMFAKAPIAGQVKTRLTPHCSYEQAAAIAEILLQESLSKVVKYWPGQVYLSIWQYNEHPFIKSMIERFNIELLSQVEGDLGAKMLSTFYQLEGPAAIMGCDAPLVSEGALKLAHTLLSDDQNVIGPSEDGGYYLIGLSEPKDILFDGVSWGHDSVLKETLKLATTNHIELHKLPTSFDIDHWTDVLRASKQLPTLHTYIDTIK